MGHEENVITYKSDLDKLAKLGLAEAKKEGRSLVFSGPDFEILQIIHTTREKGMGDLFPMEILEPYAACIRSLVRLEIELFRQRVLEGAEIPEMPFAELTTQATKLGERLVVTMRRKLTIFEIDVLMKGSESSGNKANPPKKHNTAKTRKSSKSRKNRKR